MASIPPRLALFDSDGRLVDSQADICTAMEAAFAGEGLTPPDRHAIRSSPRPAGTSTRCLH